ncbi:sphingosine-1-phosphate phosphatase 1-like [Ischnura elegans]|uniref:sphingosine-1-phosphate phosphatase 1-like n=1 Tax=Ischnura elegans TaxID=197161 RepID=UPI001ED8BBF3|nr:sphingosine-1-phosphate phosphatase 1-like [Ischnura elegans]
MPRFRTNYLSGISTCFEGEGTFGTPPVIKGEGVANVLKVARGSHSVLLSSFFFFLLLLSSPALHPHGGSSVQDTRVAAGDALSSESDSETKDYVVTNRFWYYLFCLGTALGDEIFYASFIPFWFWNIDGAVGRRVVLVWAITMYIGQGIKDIVGWPRPASPPVFRLQKKWALEYGMPSTHAMVGASIPLSVILYTMDRYQYSIICGVLFAMVWCSVVCMSRLYLGMHSVLDIVAGLVLVLLLMVPLIPLVDAMDQFCLTHKHSPLLLSTAAVLMVIYSPSGDRWTPTRGDTTVVLGVSLGVHVGAWTNYHSGAMQELFPKPSLPHAILWPSYEMMGLMLLRTALGFSCIVATRAICKWASYATLRAVLLGTNKSPNEPSTSRAEVAVELGYKFFTYAAVGFNTLYLLPGAFRLLRIERPTFYTEI